MKDFLKEMIRTNFDKLLLAIIVVYLLHAVVFISLYIHNPETLSWARELTSGFAGGLLGLITGVHIGQRMAQKSQDDLPKEKPE